jgi:hypothetical protein
MANPDSAMSVTDLIAASTSFEGNTYRPARACSGQSGRRPERPPVAAAMPAWIEELLAWRAVSVWVSFIYVQDGPCVTMDC